MRLVIVYVLFVSVYMQLTSFLIRHFVNSPDLMTDVKEFRDGLFIVFTLLLLYVERKQADTSQARSEQRFRLIADFAYDWEYWLGTNGELLYVSPSCERLSGYTVEEFMANPALLTSILHPEDRSRIASLHNPPEGGEEFNTEFRILRKDGEEYWIGHVCRQVYDAQGKPMGVRVSNRDITKRRHYQKLERIRAEELFQADKMITLGTLVSGVAHEINNPTNFITLNAPLLREAWQGVQPILEEHYRQEGDFYVGRFQYSVLRQRMEQLFDGVFDGANRIKRIVSSLKDFARPDPSDMNQIVDVNRVIQNAVTLLKSPIGKQTKHFHLDCADTLPRITGSAQKLEQVMINLIQNALESLDDADKSVSVRSSYDEQQQQIAIDVEDEGSGIPEDVLNRIFDPFFTTKRNSGGTGLGLSIGERIVKEHGGSINFNSTPGKGTQVKVLLPLAQTVSKTS